MENIQKIIELIEKEYNENERKIHELDYKIKVLDVNTIQRKGELLAISSVIPFCILQSVGPALVILFNIIPFIYLIEPLIIGSSLIIGAIPALKIYKKYAWKKRLKKISKATTQKEIIEEKTRYEIEKEKLMNLNKILALILNDLQKRKDLIEQGYVKQKNNDKLEEVRVNIENLTDTINSYIEKINILSTKSILKHKFGKFLDKGYIRFEEIVISFAGGTFLSVFLLLPNMVTQIGNALHVIITFFSSSLIIAGVLTKFNRDKKSVFEKMNNELGEDALQKTNLLDFSNKENIKELNLEDLIKRVSQLRLQLEEELIKKDQLENSITNENKEAKNVIENTNLYDNYLFDELGFSIEEKCNDTIPIKEKGKVLQKTRILNKK